jgi:hypothetical protein
VISLSAGVSIFTTNSAVIPSGISVCAVIIDTFGAFKESIISTVASALDVSIIELDPDTSFNSTLKFSFPSYLASTIVLIFNGTSVSPAGIIIVYILGAI